MSTTPAQTPFWDNVEWNQSTFGGNPPPTCNIKCRDVLYIAFREARILKRPQGLNSGSELADGLIFLNQQLNYWAARGCYAWTTTFQVYTLTPGYQPHLIGPDLVPPDFNVALRPTGIVSASVILPGNTTTDVPIKIRDNAWWAGNSVKNLQSTFPTDLYYEADYPNGELWFWPIATAGYQVRLEGNIVLQQFNTLDDCFIAPQAYLAAITLTLAEELVDIWGTEMPGNLARRAVKARDALQSNNNLPPRIASADYGTFSRSSCADFNYMTGQPPSK
jgi:hypothetical protein